jgi:hypothetical protein
VWLCSAQLVYSLWSKDASIKQDWALVSLFISGEFLSWMSVISMMVMGGWGGREIMGVERLWLWLIRK